MVLSWTEYFDSRGRDSVFCSCEQCIQSSLAMNQLLLFKRVLEECRKRRAQWPDSQPLLSIEKQLEYLVDLTEGRRSDTQLMANLNLRLVISDFACVPVSLFSFPARFLTRGLAWAESRRAFSVSIAIRARSLTSTNPRAKWRNFSAS